jgi:hypothetical protein
MKTIHRSLDNIPLPDVRRLWIILLALTAMSAPTEYTEREKAIAGWAYNCGYAHGLEQAAAKMSGLPEPEISDSCKRFLAAFSVTHKGGGH